jgi:hypothetical protein
MKGVSFVSTLRIYHAYGYSQADNLLNLFLWLRVQRVAILVRFMLVKLTILMCSRQAVTAGNGADVEWPVVNFHLIEYYTLLKRFSSAYRRFNAFLQVRHSRDLPLFP